MHVRTLIAGLILAALLAGCGGLSAVPQQHAQQPTLTTTPARPATAVAATAGETATGLPVQAATVVPKTGTAPAAASGASARPIDPAICEELRARVARLLVVETTATQAPFQDIVTGVTGTGCRLEAKGTGAHFQSFPDVAAGLGSLLRTQGWTEDPRYLADGPTGTASGFRKDSMLALVSAGWNPMRDVVCPGPISGCYIPREKQLFTVAVDLAEVDPAGDGPEPSTPAGAAWTPGGD